MKRRTMLSAGAAALTAGLAGCSAALGAPTDGEQQPLYPDRRTIPARATTHHLFVENADAESHVGTLTVTRTSDDALVWRGTYEIPDERGLEIPDLLVEGRTYEIALDVDGGPRETTIQNIEPCPRSGSRNTSAMIADGSIRFQQDNCDAISVPTLPTGPHEGFLHAEQD
ncbi:MAG: hypothetical protein ACI8UR_000735 [Natronomonas sp.]|jgi:hypothetical protein|uniref:hypothetical protein n=1 Tax=Natronomonas sp. TaxID=2184060 RepID=UPI003989FC1B